MTMILDGIIILMLAATIIYAARLNAKLNVMRDQKEAMAASLQAFSQATDTAILAVEELQVKGENVCKTIEQRINKGQVLADDIQYLLEKAMKQMREFEQKQPATVRTAEVKPQAAKGVSGFSQDDLVSLLRKKQAQINAAPTKRNAFAN